MWPAFVNARLACQTSPSHDPSYKGTGARDHHDRRRIHRSRIGGIEIEGGRITATSGGRSRNGVLTDGERRALQEPIEIVDANAAGHGSPDQIRYVLKAGDRVAVKRGGPRPAALSPSELLTRRDAPGRRGGSDRSATPPLSSARTRPNVAAPGVDVGQHHQRIDGVGRVAKACRAIEKGRPARRKLTRQAVGMHSLPT